MITKMIENAYDTRSEIIPAEEVEKLQVVLSRYKDEESKNEKSNCCIHGEKECSVRSGADCGDWKDRRARVMVERKIIRD